MNLYIPKSLLTILPTLTYPNEICILCNMIYTNDNYDSYGNKFPYSQLHSHAIQKRLGRHRAKPAMEEGIKRGIIVRRDKGKEGAYYLAGKQCKLYKLGPDYKESKMVNYTITTKARNPVKEKEFKHNLRGVYLKLFNLLPNLEMERLSDDEIRILIGTEPEYDSWGMLKSKTEQFNTLRKESDKLINRQFYGKKGKNNGRFYSNLTGIKRTARRHLKSRGRNLVSFDMSTTQPNLLGLKILQLVEVERANCRKSAAREQLFLQYVRQVVKTYQKPLVLEPISNEETFFSLVLIDLEAFITNECQSGKLYDNIASFLGITRDEAKKEVLRYLFGKHGSKRFKVNMYFETFYLYLNAFFSYIKRENTPSLKKKKNHNILAGMLQKMESELFINTIVKRILTEHPQMVLYTIHDAVLCEEGPDEHIVKEIMTEEISKLIKNPIIKRSVYV